MKSRLFILLCMAISWFAQTGAETTLNVDLANGTTASFPLSSTPEITFSTTDMTVSSPEGIFSYPRQSVSQVYFKNNGAGVDGVTIPTLSYTLTMSRLKISGIGNSDVVGVYNMSGSVVPVNEERTANEVTLDFSTRTKEFYIITVKGHPTLKIYIK